MKRIVCEMCGGTDFAKQDGMFVCQSCGCKYTIEDARKLMVEVAGTVEVTGTVKVDSSESVESFLRMAKNAADAGNNKEAEDYANRIIELDANNWEAWLLKGKAAGWQSTIKNIRFSESVNAFAQAVSCAPEEKKEAIHDEAREEIKKLSVALVQLRASRFEKWPDDEETEGAKTDLAAILQAIEQFNQRLGSNVELSEMIRPIAVIITDSVRSAWERLAKPEYEADSDGHPDDYALTKLIDRAGNCLSLMRTVMAVADEEDEANLARYDLMIGIHEYCIDAKSYEKKVWTDYKTTWEGDEYFTREQWVTSKTLDASAVELRKEEIEKWKEKKRIIHKYVVENVPRASSSDEFKEKNRIFSLASKLFSVGEHHTVALKTDGTVLAVGENTTGACNVASWRDIVAVSAGANHTVGLKSDGTVVATKIIPQKYFAGDCGQCAVSDWRDIVAISAGECHTVGMKADGTVVATGRNRYGECNVSDWTDIVAISAGRVLTLGLKADGTTVSTAIIAEETSSLNEGQGDVEDWIDIVDISTRADHSVGLRADGTVVATGNQNLRRDQFLKSHSYHGQCDVEDWKNIVGVSAGYDHTVGLKEDGTVVATWYIGDKDYERGQCNVSGWKDIVAVQAGVWCTVGLKADGTMIATEWNKFGQCSIQNWKLFNSIDTLEAEQAAARKAAAERDEAERKARIEALTKEKATLQAMLPSIKGLFAGSKKAKIESRLTEIEAELKTLG